jgi:hypothetical protein
MLKRYRITTIHQRFMHQEEGVQTIAASQAQTSPEGHLTLLSPDLKTGYNMHVVAFFAKGTFREVVELGEAGQLPGLELEA